MDRRIRLHASLRRGLGAAARWAASRAAGIVFLLVLATGAALSLTNPALLRSPDAPLATGEWTAAYQRAFDAESPLLGPARTVRGVLEWTFFREVATGALVGDEGWLFSREEFVWPGGAEAALAANLDRVAEIRGALAERGAATVVVLVPAKARLHAGRLGRYTLPPGPAGRYDAALAGLEARGVPVVGAAAPLSDLQASGTPPFLRTDTHWRPAGAAAVAAATAAVVRERAPFGGLDARDYETRDTPPERYRGDLFSFFHLGPLHDRLAPPDDLLVRREVVGTDAAGGDLFGAPDIPVALVGTSYSADETWNFAGSLRLALGADVLNAARRGDGPLEPMTRYLESDAFRSTPPEVVVWEIPERYLTQPAMAAPGTAGAAATPETEVLP